MSKSYLLIGLLILFPGCQSRKSDKVQEQSQTKETVELKGKIDIGGAYALYPVVQNIAADFMKIHPGVTVTVNKTGTGQGIEDLFNRKIHLAMISRELTDSEAEEGIWLFPVAKDGVAPIINQNNPLAERILDRGLSTDELQKIFTEESALTWGELLDTNQKAKVVVYSRADDSGAADILAALFYRQASDFKGIRVIGDDEMIKSIQNNPLAVGFCNFSYAFDPRTGERKKDIQVIPFDLDFDNKIGRRETPFRTLEEAHRSIWLGIYPESLCRSLALGTIGKPSDPVIIEFLKYILTEGQADVQKAGLCELNSVYTESALEKLN